MTQPVQVVQLAEVLQQRECRLRELTLYIQKRDELEMKLMFIQEELNITKVLIDLIKKENSANSLSVI